MFSFPNDSLVRARKIAGEYSSRSRSKLNQAVELYNGKFFHIGYGFSESIRSGNCGRYLHEIKKEADCFTMAGVLYLIARESGLKPQIFRAANMKDLKEGQSPTSEGENEHTFITVNTSKDKFYVVDPFFSLIGRADFDNSHNQIKVYDQWKRRFTYRHFSSLTEISEQQYLESLERNRSPQGGRLTLSATQKVKGANGNFVFVSYSDDDSKLVFSQRKTLPRVVKESYKKNKVNELSMLVEDDGSFDISSGELSFYYASAAGWTTHVNPQVPLRIPVSTAQKLWGVWFDVMGSRGVKIDRISDQVRLEELLFGAGLEKTFGIFHKNDDSNFLSDDHFSINLFQAQKSIDKSASRFVEESKTDDISYRVLLRDAHYFKASDACRTVDNPHGIIFSDSQREVFAKELFREYVGSTKRILRTVIDNACVKAKLKKGSNFSADRKWNSTFEKEGDFVDYFGYLCALRKSSNPKLFPVCVDEDLFWLTCDVNRSVEELSSGLTDNDLLRVGMVRAFHRITELFIDRSSMFLKSYHPGIKKILTKR